MRLKMSKKNIKAITAAILAFIPLFYGSKYFKSSSEEMITSGGSIERLYESRQSGVMVEFDGLIVKLLSDDLEGSRHQRFIVKLDSNHTVLIAHNIDVAPRVPIEEGKKIQIYGQYEWNEKGGVVHWTHRDSMGQHEEGWIKFQGRIYD